MVTNALTPDQAAAITNALTTRQLTVEMWGRYCVDVGPAEWHARVLELARSVGGRVDDDELLAALKED